MSQKLPVNKFEWIEDTSQFNEDFIKVSNAESNEGYFLEVNVQYTEKLHKLHNNLPFLLERTQPKKVEKRVANWYHKTEYAIHVGNSNEALTHGLIFIGWLNLIKKFF